MNITLPESLRAATEWPIPRGMTLTVYQDLRPGRPHRAQLRAGFRVIWLRLWDSEAPCSVRAKLDRAAWELTVVRRTQRPTSPRNGGSVYARKSCPATSGNARFFGTR